MTRTMHQRVVDGELPVVWIGRSVRFRSADLEGLAAHASPWLFPGEYYQMPWPGKEGHPPSTHRWR